MEKHLSVRHQQVVGSPTFPPGVFAGAAVFEREEAAAKAHRGKFYVLISLLGPKNFDAVLSSKIILDLLEEEYFRDLEGSPLTALEKAAVSANHRFIDLTLGSSAVSGSVEFNLILAVAWGQVLYLSKSGAAAVYLLRGGVVKEIVMGEETQVATASGLIADGDVLILGTRAFKEAFPPERLLTVLPRIEEEIGQSADKHLTAALILKFDIEETPAAAEIIHFAQGRSGMPSVRLPSLAAAKKLAFHWLSVVGRVGKVGLPPGLRLRNRLDFRRSRPRSIGLKFIILLLALAFVSSVVFTLQKQNASRLRSETQKLMESARLNVSSAQDLVDLNNLRAKGLLSEAIASLDKVKRFGRGSTEVENLYLQARQLLSRVTKEKTVSPKLLYDFSLQDKQSQPFSLAAEPGQVAGDLFVSDHGLSVVYRVRPGGETVSVEKIDKGLLTDPSFVSVSADLLFGLEKKGLFLISLKDLSPKTGVLTAIGEVRDFRAYLGNLYFLSPQTGITKSFALESQEYAPPTPWLKEERDFSKVSTLAVDGSIYVLDRQGQITKFEGGRPSDFSLSGFDGTFSALSTIHADPFNAYLYVFDGNVPYLVVFSKDGVYQRRLTFVGGEIPQGLSLPFTVNEAAKKVYFLAKQKLFQIDLE